MKIQTLSAILVALLFHPAAAPAQHLVNTTGQILSSPSMTVEYSIGEPVISTLLAAGEAATQGFVQPDYGSDCALAVPVAVSDEAVLNLPAGEKSVVVLPLANDNLPAGATFSLEIITEATQGSATISGENAIVFEWPNPDTGAVDSFRYRVCVVDCPDLCASATVRILTETEKRFNSRILTPTVRDGLNDVFDPVYELERRPENAGRRVAEAELAIFNRWGEVVFREKSLAPKWDGTAVGNKSVPQATYYFVLKATDTAGKAFEPELGTLTVLL